MTVVASLDLQEAWADLLRRRPSLAPTLEPQGEIFSRWAGTSARVTPLAWTAAECRRLWERGVPLAVEAAPSLAVDDVEELVAAALQMASGVREGAADGITRFARSWDRGEITPRSLLPSRGRLGVVPESVGLAPEVVSFAATVGLRPLLEAYFARCREHPSDGVWTLGVCPFCGGPPGWGDIVEDGRRRLACHVCGGGWFFSRAQCPHCGNAESRSLVRLEPGGGEEGYSITACTACRAYLKELDRRVRWNGGPAVVEDWGSPHFDMAARRSGYWRPLPSLIELGM